MENCINIPVHLLSHCIVFRQVIGSYNVALDTARLLRNVVAATRWKKVQDLIDKVREVGKWMEQAQPTGSYRERKKNFGIIRVENLTIRGENLWNIKFSMP